MTNFNQFSCQSPLFQITFNNSVAPSIHSDEFSEISKNGNFAYVEQVPWIKNCTIKDNIIFMEEYDEDKYQKVIEICELREDLQILPYGDLTEIGERGINLSGGQKARVSLARALYSDRDIYLLDDPLSALDSNVKYKIFHNYIKKELCKKTVILVSHCIEFLNEADRILILDHGKLSFDGTYATLINTREYTSLLEKINFGKISEETKSENIPIKKEKNTMKNTSTNGRIIEEEESIRGRVNSWVYKRYLTNLGGKRFLFLLSVVLLCWTFCSIGADYWLGLWANSTSKNSKGYFFLIMNSVFAFISVVCIFFRILITFHSSLKASKTLHKDMITRLMQAPVNLFFDKTPVGRVMNRLSNDLTNVDYDLPFIIGNTLMGFSNLFGRLIMAIILIYWCIIPIPFVLLAFFYYFYYYIKVQVLFQWEFTIYL